MSGKNKQHEVSTARIRLNATLQDLVDKKEDSQLSDDEGEESLSQIELMRAPSSPLSSPSKRLAKSSSRKRKRKDDLDGLDTGHYHHTYVMKLFDRSVDLAQFDDNSPLYPICRAWMQNQPHNRNLAPHHSPSPEPEPLQSTSGDEESGEEKIHNVYKMPGPMPLKRDPAEYRDMRVPSPVPQPDETLDVNADPENAPPPEQLLLNHMERWKIIRQKWRDASHHNEVRFAPSLDILRDMYDRQCKEN